MKIELKGKAIPRNEAGDPCFATLLGVSNVFTPEEVVTLVNRALYQLEYQHTSHKNRAQRQRDEQKAIKKKVHMLYGVSWLKATEDQIKRATEEVLKEKATAP